MNAVRYRNGSGEIRIGRLDGDTIVDAGASGPRGFIPDAANWSALRGASGASHAAADVTFLPPVVPTKVICIGLNYRDHAAESQLAIPELPVVFAKWPSSLIGHGADIALPPEESRPDYEAELAVIFSRTFTRTSQADARATIGAYTAFNDVSGRQYQLDTPLRQFTVGKSFDTFGPIGPCLVEAEGVDLGALDVKLMLSGEVRQSSNTRNFIFPIERLVEYVSMATTIEAGDVLITGTPGGVGDSSDPRRYLRAGDVVEVDVEGVPTLRNTVRSG